MNIGPVQPEATSLTAEQCFALFDRTIIDYHRYDSLEQPMENPHAPDSLPGLLYSKNWIDTVQWHLEDLTRIPDAPDSQIADLKRQIDRSNQRRTDTVERIDDWFMAHACAPVRQDRALLNSETPAWLLDRMSILALKIYHMTEQTQRKDASPEHRAACQQKLDILLEQKMDLSRCFDELLADLRSGQRYFKLYRQMKMYNDQNLNPALYSRK